MYFPAAIDDGAGLDVCDDLEELWRVERDGEDDDEELVELDVVLGEERGEPELAVVADADVTLEAERNHFVEELVKGSKEAITESFKTFLLSFENHSQNVPLPTQKIHYGAIFQPAIPKTRQECFYITLYLVAQPPTKLSSLFLI